MNIGNFYNKIASATKNFIVPELKHVEMELESKSVELAKTQEKLAKAQAQIDNANAINAKVFHTIANTEKRWISHTNSVKEIAANSEKIDNALKNVAKDTYTTEDLKTLKDYSKSLKSIWLNYTKEPNFYNRNLEFCKSELKGFSTNMLHPQYASTALRVYSKSGKEYNKAYKTLDLMTNSKKTCELGNEFVEKYYDKMYPHTAQLRDQVTKKHLQMME